jgi:hypothetical protein
VLRGLQALGESSRITPFVADLSHSMMVVSRAEWALWRIVGVQDISSDAGQTEVRQLADELLFPEKEDNPQRDQDFTLISSTILGTSRLEFQQLGQKKAAIKPADLANLIKKLGDEEFDTREKATNDLLEKATFGDLLAMRDALAKYKDREIQSRLEKIITDVSRSQDRTLRNEMALLYRTTFAIVRSRNKSMTVVRDDVIGFFETVTKTYSNTPVGSDAEGYLKTLQRLKD